MYLSYVWKTQTLLQSKQNGRMYISTNSPRRVNGFTNTEMLLASQIKYTESSLYLTYASALGQNYNLYLLHQWNSLRFLILVVYYCKKMFKSYLQAHQLKEQIGPECIQPPLAPLQVPLKPGLFGVFLSSFLPQRPSASKDSRR